MCKLVFIKKPPRART